MSCYTLKDKAYAKVNLTLDILKKREDSYHEIYSLMQTISLFDDIEINFCKSEKSEIFLNCDNTLFQCEKEKNLCYLAAKAFIENFETDPHKIEININKKIPVGAGLGGGSSNAATVLKLMAKFFKIEKDSEALKKTALELGADVPFFLNGGMQAAGGIGEELTRLNYKINGWIVLAKPEKSVLSGEVYRLYDSIESSKQKEKESSYTHKLLNALKNGKDFYKYMSNDLQKASLILCPEMKNIEREFLNFEALAALMSGSGTTVFGLFDKYENAVVAMNIVKPIISFCGIYELV